MAKISWHLVKGLDTGWTLAKRINGVSRLIGKRAVPGDGIYRVKSEMIKEIGRDDETESSQISWRARRTTTSKRN
jgi:hypothetical protein